MVRIYKITSRHSQLTDISTPHLQDEVLPIGSGILVSPLFYGEVGAGTWAESAGVGIWGYRTIYNSSNADGDYIIFKIYLTKGIYNLKVYAMKASNRGIVKFYIDNSEIASYDLYASTNTPVLLSQTGINISSSGLKTVNMKVVGKNESSTGYIIEVSGFYIYRTS